MVPMKFTYYTEPYVVRQGPRQLATSAVHQRVDHDSEIGLTAPGIMKQEEIDAVHGRYRSDRAKVTS